MKWRRASIKREFESGKNWYMETSKHRGKVFHKICGYNYNTGPSTQIYGTGYSEKESWESVVNECQRRIDWIKEIQEDAQKQISEVNP